MNTLVVSVSLLALIAAASLSSADQTKASNLVGTAATAQQALERQGRSLSGSASSGNALSSSSNTIEHSSSKSRMEQEKRQIAEFLTPKNIFKSIVKILFGSQEEISATSRHVLGVLGKVLDLLKNTFGQKSRSGTARTIRDSAEDAANAGVSMLQGYVKSVLSNDESCMKRYLCQASKEATRDSRDLGYVIASVGGYASSYLLDSANAAPNKDPKFYQLHQASMKGRSANEDCFKSYECNE